MYSVYSTAPWPSLGFTINFGDLYLGSLKMRHNNYNYTCTPCLPTAGWSGWLAPPLLVTLVVMYQVYVVFNSLAMSVSNDEQKVRAREGGTGTGQACQGEGGREGEGGYIYTWLCDMM